MPKCKAQFIFRPKNYPSEKRELFCISNKVCLTMRSSSSLHSFYFLFYIYYLFIFRERGREGGREREKHQCVVASHHPQLRTWPATQACALTGNRTSNSLVHKPALNPLSSQGSIPIFRVIERH